MGSEIRVKKGPPSIMARQGASRACCRDVSPGCGGMLVGDLPGDVEHNAGLVGWA